jgi:hypothetical protein
MPTVDYLRPTIPVSTPAALGELGMTAGGALQVHDGTSAKTVYVGTPTGGSTTLKSVEVNFGTHNTRYGRFTVTDAAVTTSSHIMATLAGEAATGHSADEAEMDPMLVSAIAGTGQLTLVARSLDGPVRGAYRFVYVIG